MLRKTSIRNDTCACALHFFDLLFVFFIVIKLLDRDFFLQNRRKNYPKLQRARSWFFSKRLKHKKPFFQPFLLTLSNLRMCVFCHNIHCHVIAKVLGLRGGPLIKHLCKRIENALSKPLTLNAGKMSYILPTY